jgi:hypothetical protein
MVKAELLVGPNGRRRLFGSDLSSIFRTPLEFMLQCTQVSDFVSFRHGSSCCLYAHVPAALELYPCSLLMATCSAAPAPIQFCASVSRFALRAGVPKVWQGTRAGLAKDAGRARAIGFGSEHGDGVEPSRVPPQSKRASPRLL